jgi:hypothetical protein
MPEAAIVAVAVTCALAALASVLHINHLAERVAAAPPPPPEGTSIKVVVEDGHVVLACIVSGSVVVECVLTPKEAADLADMLLERGYAACDQARPAPGGAAPVA